MKFRIDTKESVIYDYFQQELKNNFHLNGIPIFFDKNLKFDKELNVRRMADYNHIVGYKSIDKKTSVCNDDEKTLKYCPNKNICGTIPYRHFCIYRAIHIKKLFFILNKLENNDFANLKAHEFTQQNKTKIEILYKNPKNNQNYLVVLRYDTIKTPKYFIISSYSITTAKVNKFNKFYQTNKKII